MRPARDAAYEKPDYQPGRSRRDARSVEPHGSGSNKKRLESKPDAPSASIATSAMAGGETDPIPPPAAREAAPAGSRVCGGVASRGASLYALNPAPSRPRRSPDRVDDSTLYRAAFDEAVQAPVIADEKGGIEVAGAFSREASVCEATRCDVPAAPERRISQADVALDPPFSGPDRVAPSTERERLATDRVATPGVATSCVATGRVAPTGVVLDGTGSGGAAPGAVAPGGVAPGGVAPGAVAPGAVAAGGLVGVAGVGPRGVAPDGVPASGFPRAGIPASGVPVLGCGPGFPDVRVAPVGVRVVGTLLVPRVAPRPAWPRVRVRVGGAHRAWPCAHFTVSLGEGVVLGGTASLGGPEIFLTRVGVELDVARPSIRERAAGIRLPRPDPRAPTVRIGLPPPDTRTPAPAPGTGLSPADARTPEAPIGPPPPDTPPAGIELPPPDTDTPAAGTGPPPPDTDACAPAPGTGLPAPGTGLPPADARTPEAPIELPPPDTDTAAAGTGLPPPETDTAAAGTGPPPRDTDTPAPRTEPLPPEPWTPTAGSELFPRVDGDKPLASIDGTTTRAHALTENGPTSRPAASAVTLSRESFSGFLDANADAMTAVG